MSEYLTKQVASLITAKKLKIDKRELQLICDGMFQLKKCPQITITVINENDVELSIE